MRMLLIGCLLVLVLPAEESWREDLIALRALQEQALARWQAGCAAHVPVAVTLRLPRFIGSARLEACDLVVHLRWSEGQARWLTAWANTVKTGRSWSAARHEVDAAGLRREGGRLFGTVAVRIQSDLRDHTTPKLGELIPVALAIEATLDPDGKVRGKAACAPIHQRGERRLLGAYASAVDGGHGRLPSDWPTVGEARTASEAEQVALRVYEHLLALRWAELNHLSPEEALGLVIPWRPAPEREARSSSAQIAKLLPLARLAAASIGQPPPTVATGPCASPDPAFGPWFDDGPLPVVDGAQLLPETAGASTWASLRRWRILGPLPLLAGRGPGAQDQQRGSFIHPEAPPLAWVEDAAYAVDLAKMTLLRGWPADRAAWQEVTTAERWVKPPWRVGRVSHGAPGALHRGGLLAETWIDNVAAGERWLGLELPGHDSEAALWVDERLVWRSAPGEDPAKAAPVVLPVRLRQGRNRILLHVEGSIIRPFAMGICTAGGPRDEPACAAATAMDDKQQRGWRAERAQTVGYQRDGTGCWPEADVPLAWDPATGRNLRWQASLKGGVGGSPLILGDTVIVTEEPDTVVGLARADGTERWRTRLALDDGVVVKKKFEWWEASTYSTPVTDGRMVWVQLGTGVVGCIDAQGQVVWLRRHGDIQTDTLCSPALSGDQLLLQVPMPGVKVGGKLREALDLTAFTKGDAAVAEDRHDNLHLLCLDAGTGTERWRVPVSAGSDSTLGHGLTRLRCADGSLLPVLLNQHGRLLRIADGKVLIERIWPMREALDWARPVVQGSKVWYIIGHGSYGCLELVARDADTVAAKSVWRSRDMTLSDAQNVGMHILVAAGCCYAHGPVMGGGVSRSGYQQLRVLDSGSGRLVADLPLTKECSDTYPPDVQIGNQLYFLHNQGFTVTLAGPNPQPLVENRTDLGPGQANWSPPVVSGDAVYLRSGTMLRCLAYGEGGKDWERERITAAIMDRIPAEPHWEAEAPVAQPLPEATRVPATVPIRPVRRRTAPDALVRCGPFPSAAGDPLTLPALSLVTPGGIATLGDAAVTPELLDPRHISHKAEEVWNSAAGGILAYQESLQLDVLAPLGDAPRDTCTVYGCLLRNERERVLRLKLSGGAYTVVSLGGVELVDQGLVRLAPGVYPLLIRVRFGAVPMLGRLVAQVVLAEADTVLTARQEWLDLLGTNRQLLERVAADPANRHHADRARHLLAMLPAP